MYDKHDNLVDADASGAKASTKHLESRVEVIQGHTFGTAEKPTKDCVLLYNNVGFSVGNFEGKVSVFENPTVIGRPLSREPVRIFAHPYICRNYNH